MKKLHSLTYLLIIITLITSCISGRFRVEPKPRSSSNTLVLGHIKMIAHNFDGPFGFNSEMVIGLDGTYKSNLVIEFLHISSGKRYSIVTQSIDKDYGLLFSKNLPKGKYLMTKINFKTEAIAGGGTYWFDLWDSPYLSFTLENNKVNNLGEIEINYYKKTFEHKYHAKYTITSSSKREYNRNYLSIQQWFKERYQKSIWNNFDWINTHFTKP